MATTGLKDVLYERNKRTFRFTVTDEDNGGYLDLAPYTAKWAMSQIMDDGSVTTPVLEKATGGNGITYIDAPNGVLDVALVSADTDGITGEYYFELELFDGTDEGVVVATGYLTILANVDNTL